LQKSCGHIIRLLFVSAWLISLGLLDSCSDSKAHILGVDGWMGVVDFSEDGNYLLTEYMQGVNNAGSSGRVGVIEVFETGSWRKVMEYHSPGWIAGGMLMCADPDVIIHGEEKIPGADNPVLILRSISTTNEIATYEVDHLPLFQTNSRDYHCSIQNNVVYIDAFTDKITAINGSTGEIVREYVAEYLGDYAPFFVQEDQDRLVIVDSHNAVLWVYRLSAGALLSKIDMWPDDRPDASVVDYELMDDDHLAFGLLGQKDGVGGAYLVKVDLAALSVESEFYMGPYDLHALVVMEHGDGKVCAYMHEPNAWCGQVRYYDTNLGVGSVGIDLCDVGSGENFDAVSIPDLKLFMLNDWNPSDDSGKHNYIFSYPDFTLVETPMHKSYSGIKYASNVKLAAMLNIATDHIGIFDPFKPGLLDDFKFCTSVYDSSFIIDPSGRWAAVVCQGERHDSSDPDADLVPPSGAGVAVVDLGRYRSASFDGGVTCKKDGDCPLDKVCGEGVCKKKECLPASCQAEGAQCGYIMDGCGNFLDCGPCPDGICIDGACAENAWVQIPGGSFMMGSETGENDEKPMHQVTVPPFEIMRTEVTNWLYCRCVNDGYCNVPQSGLGCDLQIGDSGSRPVNYLEWPQASMFCRWAGGRLPTEAEWEYAARSAGQDITYPWGDETATCQYAVMNDGGPGCGQNWAQPVCSKPAGNTAQGLCDMAGNVAEWMKDCHHGDYTGAPDDGSEWNDDSCSAYRVMRGGSYIDGSGLLRATDRSPRAVQDIGYNFQGVRCAR